MRFPTDKRHFLDIVGGDKPLPYTEFNVGETLVVFRICFLRHAKENQRTGDSLHR